MSNLSEWDEAAQAVSKITTEELDEWGRKYDAAYKAYEVVKEEASRLYREFEAVEGKFVEALTQSGKKSYPVEGVGTFSFSERMSVQTPKTEEEKKLLAKYATEKGLFWKIFGVNSQTLQSFYKSEFEEFKHMCEASGASDTFHIPGLQPPTAVRTLCLRSEKKK